MLFIMFNSVMVESRMSFRTITRDHSVSVEVPDISFPSVSSSTTEHALTHHFLVLVHLLLNML